MPVAEPNSGGDLAAPRTSNLAPVRVGQGPLGLAAGIPLAGGAVLAFHTAFLIDRCWWLAVVYLACLFALRRLRSARQAFYTGLGIGLGLFPPHLHFFWALFGPAAAVLWLVLAFWHGLFLLLLRAVHERGGTAWATLWAPVLWLGVEYFRSELYYLRFSWLTVGYLLPVSVSGPLLPWLGVYGVSVPLMLLGAFLARGVEDLRSARGWPRSGALLGFGVAIVGLGAAYALGVSRAQSRAEPTQALRVAGIQLEFPALPEVLAHLERVLTSHPETELFVLSEYTFQGPVPEEVRQWCRQHRRWLLAGGKEPVGTDRFYNTAYGIGPDGEVAFQQAKAVPIQFFQDGEPAPEQRIWASPWGPLGVCICYDLNYSRVVDRLIRQGARALLVPAMDVEAWGRHEHRLNAQLTPVRAAEHRVPILRVASSGISQLIGGTDGQVSAVGAVPGQGDVIAGRLEWPAHRRPALPWDRWLGPLSVWASGALLLWLGVEALRRQRPPRAAPAPVRRPLTPAGKANVAGDPPAPPNPSCTPSG
ncbi:MAG: hypothetical protein FJ387_10555 [Verrucomicrobia bacterium]|nr:hypothetical protein [Verrucomicrobiota bacterium]